MLEELRLIYVREYVKQQPYLNLFIEFDTPPLGLLSPTSPAMLLLGPTFGFKNAPSGLLKLRLLNLPLPFLVPKIGIPTC